MKKRSKLLAVVCATAFEEAAKKFIEKMCLKNQPFRARPIFAKRLDTEHTAV